MVTIKLILFIVLFIGIDFLVFVISAMFFLLLVFITICCLVVVFFAIFFCQVAVFFAFFFYRIRNMTGTPFWCIGSFRSFLGPLTSRMGQLQLEEL